MYVNLSPARSVARNASTDGRRSNASGVPEERRSNGFPDAALHAGNCRLFRLYNNEGAVLHPKNQVQRSCQ